MYIWAWQAAECPPDLLISSMITEASVEAEPEAAVLGGDERGEQPGAGERVDELLRVGPVPVGLAPVLVREPGAQLADLCAKLGMRLAVISF